MNIFNWENLAFFGFFLIEIDSYSHRSNSLVCFILVISIPTLEDILVGRIFKNLRLSLTRPEFSASSANCQLQRNIRLNIIHGMFNVAALDMVNPFLGIFAIKLGASKFLVALLSSAPAAVSLLAMIPLAGYIDRSSRKKRLTFAFMLAHRCFFLAVACIPFFDLSIRAMLFVAVIAVMNFPGAVGNVAWQSFISRIIPPEHRVAAFAARNRIMNLVGTSLTVIAGLILDRLKYPIGYQIFFTTAFLLGMAELYVFSKLEEPAPECVAAPAVSGTQNTFLSYRDFLNEFLAQQRFIRYMLASVLFYFSWQIAWPLFSWYQVKILGANNLWVSVLSLMNTGGSLVGYGFWVRVLNRHGNLKTLFYATSVIFIVPAIYAFSHSLYTVAAFNLIVGAIFSGVNLALFNALLEVTPEARKTSYIAYYNTAITLSSIVAPIAGVGLLTIMNFRWAFIICAILRILGSLCFWVINQMDERHKK
jgi:MFS family permease